MSKKKPQYFYQQSGVIPYKIENNELKVLLITSRKGKKWKIPKGIVEPALSPSDSAAKEAFEEAGILGKVDKAEIGSYKYFKWGGEISVSLFAMKVERELDTWEEDFRHRKWVTPEEAVVLVEETELRRVILRLDRRFY
ncbi:MAG: NUDIX hydrolase [Melioribacteraceae bacterium]|nr:MAG: NUDIX hydrolase [Melioribacteraceae bacterium]